MHLTSRLMTSFHLRTLLGSAMAPLLILLLIHPNNVNAESGCDQNGEVDPTCLEVLSYNIKMLEGGGFPGNQRNNARAEEMIPKIGEGNHDIVVFQELYDHFPSGVIRKLLLKGPVDGPFSRSGGLMNKYGYKYKAAKREFLVVSKWPIVEEKWHRFNANPGGRVRGVLYTEIKKPGNRFGVHYHVFTTHLWWDKQDGCEGFQSAQEVREDQLSEMAQFVHDQNIPEGELIILAADYNFGGPGEKKRQNCNEQGFQTNGYTYFKNQVLQAKDLQKTDTWQPEDERILDHIFYKNQQIDNCRSYVKLLDYETDIDWGKDELSDHKPVLGHFEYDGGWDVGPSPRPPGWVQDWYGTYHGQNDGRKATLKISGHNRCQVDIELRDHERNTRLSDSVILSQDSPHHIIKDLTLTTSGCNSNSNGPCHEKTLKRLFLHSWNKDHISGMTEWQDKPYGLAFSKEGVTSRPFSGPRLDRSEWVSAWTGDFEGRLDGRRAKLSIRSNNLNLEIVLEDLERGVRFTGTTSIIAQGFSAKHILKNLELTSEDGATKHIEALYLHTWDTNYISGTTRSGDTLFGNYFVRSLQIQPPNFPNFPLMRPERH